jgi:hypothetical protein
MLNFAHGSVQWLTSQVLNTTIPVTGLGFRPKALRFYWVGLQSNSPTAANSQAVAERRGVGFASSITSRASTGTFSADASGNADCGSIFTTTACVITVDGNGAVDGLLDINSIDTDGFTLIVDDVAPANITVFWEAWGGDEITNVTIGSIAEPGAAGNQNYTATGFVASPGSSQDQCIMFAGVQSVNASGVGQIQDSGLCVGFATSTATANQVVVIGNSDDGSATMDTDGYNFTGQCLSMIVIAGGNPNARATLNAFGTDIFTLNWGARATTNRRNIYMAIKGGQWQAGSVTIAGNTLNSTTTLGTLPFNIKGISLIGAMKPISTANTATAQDRIGFGSGLSTTSRNSAAVLDEDATADSEIDLSINYTQVLVYPSVTGTLQTAYDINRIGANEIQLITDTAGGVANEWIGYLAFGDKKVTAGTIGHPFIF